MKNAGKACNNRLYRHIRTFEKIVKNYFVIYKKSCVYSKSKEGKLKWLVKKYLVEFFESKWDCGSFFNGA